MRRADELSVEDIDELAKFADNDESTSDQLTTFLLTEGTSGFWTIEDWDWLDDRVYVERLAARLIRTGTRDCWVRACALVSVEAWEPLR